MKFSDFLRERKFSLIVSLPSNDSELARAALEGGADAVKVHCNVWHRASGHTFGSYADNREFLRQLIRLCGEVPVGLVPGTDEAFITPEECRELEDMGLGFISAYSHHLPCFMMDSEKLTNVVAIGPDWSEATLDAIRDSDIEAMEASVIKGEDYGRDLMCADILQYSRIAARCGKPCVVPTQKKIRPEEVRHLYKAGCKAIMIGAVVFGRSPTPKELRSATRAFRQAVDAL